MTNYIGGGLLHRRSLMQPEEIKAVFKNPIYTGTSADSTAIKATRDIGYRTEASTSNPKQQYMQLTCWNNNIRCWFADMKFKSESYGTITAVFNRSEGSYTGGQFVLVVSEKVEDKKIAIGSVNYANMSDAYGDYLYSLVQITENGSYTASIDISNWAHKDSFYVSVLYRSPKNGYYFVAQTRSITLS